MKTHLSKQQTIGLVVGFIAFGGLVMGCTHNRLPDPAEEPTLQAGITTQVADPSYAADRASKITVDDAAYTTVFNANDEIGLYLVEFNMANTAQTDLLAKGNQTDNHKYTYNGTAWTAANNLPNPLTWRKYNAFAYHPYSASVTNALTIKHTVRTDQSAAITSQDYLMWSGRSAAATPVKGEKFSLNFTHKLTRLIINVSLPTTYNSETIKGISEVKTVAFPVGTTLNLLTGTATADAAKGEVKMSRTVAGTTLTGTFAALVVPTTVAAYQPVVQIDYTTSTGTGSLFYFAPAGGITFAENQIYTLTLNAKELIFSKELDPFIATSAAVQNTTVVTDDADLTWDLKSNDTWLTFSLDNGANYHSTITGQKGTVAITVRVTNNTTGQPRLGSLTLSSTSALYTATPRELVVLQR